MGPQRHQREPIYIRRRAHLEAVQLTVSATSFPKSRNPGSSKTLAPPLAGIGARPSNGAMPGQLPDELLEEVLRRLPPDEPADLGRAALVSRRWCRLVSDPGFRRRFREFHRRPPMLGMLCNYYEDGHKVRFDPTTASRFPHTYFQLRFGDMRVLDARHGRVLFSEEGCVLVVWNPITDEEWELPYPRESQYSAAAVLCSAAAGPCDHLHCHDGPFLVVFVCFQDRETFVYTYSSGADAWSEPVCAQQDYVPHHFMGNVLLGNALYFGNVQGSTALKYDLELRQMSLILLPSLPRETLLESLLTTTVDGVLGLINTDDSKLYLWSRKDTHEADAKWERRAIELKRVFPDNVDVIKLRVIGSGVSIVFMTTGNDVYTIDQKTYKVKKLFVGTAYNIIPYMSF